VFDDESFLEAVDCIFARHAASHEEYCHISGAVIFKKFKAQFDVWQGAVKYADDRRGLAKMRRGIWSTS
jgi:hypothetical protein